jgi:peptidoglycan hydrolase-like protein with peptidoglycan-binding domain
MWNGEGRRLVASDPERWGYAIGGPVTGVWMERFVIPAAAPNADLAEAFIDAMLQPELSLEQATARGYNTGVAAVQADLAAFDGVAIPTGDDMFGDSKDYGESLLDASAEDLRAVVVGTITSLVGASGTPTSTTDPAQSTTTAPTETTASAPDTTAAAVTSTTAQLDQKGRRVLRPSDEGPEVKDLQQRLKALGFSLGLPDGQYGDLTMAAVLAFQRSQGLQTDGVVGTYTWDALENPKPILSRDANTRGVSPTAKSDANGHSSTAAPSGGRSWVKAVIYLDSFRDEFFDANGKLVGSFPNSPGVNGLTPTGTFRVYSRSANTFFSRNPAETMKWMVRFNGGVGFHSVPRINGVPEPTPLGQAPSSHGCIRHADDVAKRIYDNLADNAVVIVQHG